MTNGTLSDADILATAKYFDLGHQGDFDATQLRAMLRLTPAERLDHHRRWGALIRRDRMEPDFVDRVVDVLLGGHVEFLIVGGVCAQLHGSPRATVDLDVCYRRTPDNLSRLADALKPLNLRPRGFPAGLPFVFDFRTLSLGSNFTLETGPNHLDLLGEMSAVGGYEAVAPRAVEVTLAGDRHVKILSLPDLIATKQAANRPKDLLALADLIPLLEETRRQAGPS